MPFCDVTVRIDHVVHREGSLPFEGQIADDAKLSGLTGLVNRTKWRDNDLASSFLF